MVVVVDSATSTSAPATFAVRNPATDALIRELPIHSKEHVFAQMERVRAAAPRWAELSVGERVSRLAGAAERIVDRADEIATVISDENGKVRIEAFLHDIGPTLMVMHYFGEHAERILAPEKIHLAIARHRRSYIAYRPKGVVGVITPWNFPFFMPGADVYMALVAGNGVLLKPSELTPLSALVLGVLPRGADRPDVFRMTGLGATGAQADRRAGCGVRVPCHGERSASRAPE